jgi:hypothetical protein
MRIANHYMCAIRIVKIIPGSIGIPWIVPGIPIIVIAVVIIILVEKSIVIIIPAVTVVDPHPEITVLAILIGGLVRIVIIIVGGNIFRYRTGRRIIYIVWGLTGLVGCGATSESEG